MIAEYQFFFGSNSFIKKILTPSSSPVFSQNIESESTTLFWRFIKMSTERQSLKMNHYTGITGKCLMAYSPYAVKTLHAVHECVLIKSMCGKIIKSAIVFENMQ